MGLLDQAKADLGAILTDDRSGFAVPIVLTDPEGNAATVHGQQTSIGITIDPQTGTAVSGRRVSIALSIAQLSSLGLTMPRGISDSSRKPWLAEFTLPTGERQVFKVAESLPDELGCLVLILEAFKP